MTFSRTLAAAALTAALAVGVTGCQGPGSTKEAVSFGSMSHTEGEVEQATNQLNALLPLQVRQRAGVSSFTRMQTISLLLFTPAIEHITDEADLAALDQRVDEQAETLHAAAPGVGEITDTTKEVLRNFIIASNNAMPNLVPTYQQLVTQQPPRVSARYGSIDWEAGGNVKPRVGGGVQFNGLQGQH